MKSILFNEKGIVTVDKVNSLAQNDLKGLISLCEDYYNGQIEKIANLLIGDNSYKIVLLAGPSGSGKTTTARKLSEKLILGGKNAVYVSLDDFFLNREDLPILENGETDFESVNTLDIAEIRKCFSLLLSGEKTTIPHFDFITGKRDPDAAKLLETGENDIVIVEGLHAINPELTQGIDAFGNKGFYKLFVNPLSQICSEDGTAVLKRRNLRLMRRMIRDYYFRGSSVENTLNMWQGVCSEEIKNIIPFKDTADCIVDTTHFYEPCIYHHYVLPILDNSEVTSDEHKKMLKELRQNRDVFYDAPADIVPIDSMIREFIGDK